jgi:hypothetical protein
LTTIKINSGNIASALGSLKPFFSSVGELGKVGDIGNFGEIDVIGILGDLGDLGEVGEGGKGIDAGETSAGDVTFEFSVVVSFLRPEFGRDCRVFFLSASIYTKIKEDN